MRLFNVSSKLGNEIKILKKFTVKTNLFRLKFNVSVKFKKINNLIIQICRTRSLLLKRNYSEKSLQWKLRI